MRTLTKISMVSIIGSIAVLVFVLFIIKPILSDIKDFKIQIKQKSIDLSALDQQIRAFKGARADLNRAVKKDNIANALVIREDLVLPVQDLEAAAAAATDEQLQIQDDSNQPVAVERPAIILGLEGVTEVPYQVNLTSDYIGMINFLSFVEHLPHFTEVSHIDLSAQIDKTSLAASATRPIHSGKVLGSFKGVFFIKSMAQPHAAAQ